MKSFLADYQSRVEEFDEYFSFIRFIDKIETHKKQNLFIDQITFVTPRRDLQKILRANCFILLYNLVESSIRNGILGVYDCIHDNGLTYYDLSDKVKDIWLSNKSQKIKLSEKNFKLSLRELIEETSVSNQIILRNDTITISGNLDYKNIQKIVTAFGFWGKITIEEKKVIKALDKIKEERNLLAHGNKTFTQSGAIITIAELETIKTVAIAYLNDLLNNISVYIDNKSYLK